MKGLHIMRKRRWGAHGLWMIPLLLLGFGAFTNDAAAQVEIVSEQMFLIASQQGPDINVLHLMTIRNVGFDTVQEVELPVPYQATQIVADNVPIESLWLEATRVADQRPIAPGESRNYVLQYIVPVRTVPLALQRNMPYPSDHVTLWLDSSRYRATGVGPGEGPRGALTFRGYETFEGVTFGIYQMEGVPVVDTWQVVIEPIDRREHMKPLDNNLVHGDPTVFFAAIKEWAIPWLFPWGVCVAVLGMLGVLLVRRRRHGDSSALKRLKDSLVDLDMRFRRGEMDELTYRHMRNELKEEALSLMERDARRAHHSGRDEVGVKDGV